MAVGALVVPRVVLQLDRHRDSNRKDCQPGRDQGQPPPEVHDSEAGGEDHHQGGRRGEKADHDLQPEQPLVVEGLLPLELQQLLLRFFLIVLHADAFPGQKLVDGDVQQPAQGQHEGGVGHAFAPLPFGDGPVCDAQLFSQGGLGEAGLFPALRDKGADFLLIHGETSFLPQP